MKFLNRKPSWMLLLVLVMLALLCVLATLQYRWLGQISQAQSEQMKRSLHSSAMSFSQDFDREITRAFMLFQLEHAKSNEQLSAQLKERFRVWDSIALYPQIVSEVYLVERDSKRGFHLSRYDKAQAKLEPADWSNDLKSIQSVLEQELSNHDEPANAEGIRKLPLGIIEQIEPNVPALIVPLMPDVIFIEREVSPLRAPLPASNKHVIVKFNADFLRKDFLPALARKYFSGSDGLDYNVAVLNNQSQSVFFQSNSQQAANAATSDIATGMFDIRAEEMTPIFYINPKGENQQTKATAIFEGRIESTRVSGKEISQHKKVEAQTVKDEKSSSLTVRVLNQTQGGDFTVKTLIEKEFQGKWKLVVQHRAGSLEAFVTNARRRNLLISFGVLVLLAVSVCLIVLATRRSQVLAQRKLEFVSSVSHEFRTPLAVICSAGENLADGIIGSPAQVSKYGKLVLKEGRRLSEMVEQVLEFAGAQEGRRRPLEFRPTEVEKVIEEALAACLPTLEEKRFEVDIDIETGLPLIEADARSLSRALQNLIANAIKYDVDQRRISVKSFATENKKSKEIVISVADKGRGIGPDELSRIFEPFYRGREAVAEQIHGNGLGLSLVKQTLTAHKGRVAVTSEVGKGSVFSIHLPVSLKVQEVTSEHAARLEQHDVKAYSD
jgi:signal transduction histidine kinase